MRADKREPLDPGRADPMAIGRIRCTSNIERGMGETGGKWYVSYCLWRSSGICTRAHDHVYHMTHGGWDRKETNLLRVNAWLSYGHGRCEYRWIALVDDQTTEIGLQGVGRWIMAELIQW